MRRGHVPYRGEPEPKYSRPKTKQILTPEEKQREFVDGALKLLLFCGIIFLITYFAFDSQFDRAWTPALFFITIFLTPFILSAGINAWNRYLRADDLDEPEDLDERREETSPEQDDKHDMAEDYLAQLKWEADHLRDPNRGIPPVRYDPKWKYKPLFGKVSGTSLGSSTGWGILFLITLIIVAGLAIAEMITTSHVNIALVILAIIFLGLILLTTREPKEPNDD